MSKYSELEEITVVGIDLAKSVFHLHGVNKQGHAVVRKKLSRNKLAEFMARLPSCLVGMEACGPRFSDNFDSISLDCCTLATVPESRRGLFSRPKDFDPW